MSHRCRYRSVAKIIRWTPAVSFHPLHLMYISSLRSTAGLQKILQCNKALLQDGIKPAEVVRVGCSVFPCCYRKASEDKSCRTSPAGRNRSASRRSFSVKKKKRKSRRQLSIFRDKGDKKKRRLLSLLSRRNRSLHVCRLLFNNVKRPLAPPPPPGGKSGEEITHFTGRRR